MKANETCPDPDAVKAAYLAGNPVGVISIDECSLEDFTKDAAAVELIRTSLKARHNIVVSGVDGSGKTTFLNACLREIALQSPYEQTVVIQDVPELRMHSTNSVSILSSNEASINDLLASSLRLSPDSIVLDEVRDGEALSALLKAWDTGHNGSSTTVYAETPPDTLERFKVLMQTATGTDQSALIHRVVDLVVHLSFDDSSPVINQIMRVHSSQDTEVLYEF